MSCGTSTKQLKQTSICFILLFFHIKLGSYDNSVIIAAELGVCAYCAQIVQIAQFALRIKAYFLGLRNMRCAFT